MTDDTSPDEPHGQPDGEVLGTPFHKSLGLRWTFADDHVVIRLALHDGVRGPSGAVEGGIVSTLIDVAAATTAAHVTRQLVVTQQMSITFLEPGKVGPIAATGTNLRVGRSAVVSEARVVDEGADDKLIAVGIAVFRLVGDLEERLDISHADWQAP